MAELKPCPFCGGRAFISAKLPYFGEVPTQAVVCELCNASSKHKRTAEQAIEAWNRRAESEELKFTREFIHEHGLEFALASAWNRRAEDGKK